MHLPVPSNQTLRMVDRSLQRASGLPLVAAKSRSPCGKRGDPADRPGLASVTARMLQQGTTTRSALQIGDRPADLGATFGLRASTETP